MSTTLSEQPLSKLSTLAKIYESCCTRNYPMVFISRSSRMCGLPDTTETLNRTAFPPDTFGVACGQFHNPQQLCCLSLQWTQPLPDLLPQLQRYPRVVTVYTRDKLCFGGRYEIRTHVSRFNRPAHQTADANHPILFAMYLPMTICTKQSTLINFCSICFPRSASWISRKSKPLILLICVMEI